MDQQDNKNSQTQQTHSTKCAGKNIKESAQQNAKFCTQDKTNNKTHNFFFLNTQQRKVRRNCPTFLLLLQVSQQDTYQRD